MEINKNVNLKDPIVRDLKKRNLNVSFYKAGNNGIATRLTLPKPWLAKMGINENDRAVELIFDEENEQLIICKKK